MVWVESRHIEQKEEVRHMPEKALFQSVLSGSAQRTMCRLAARVRKAISYRDQASPLYSFSA